MGKLDLGKTSNANKNKIFLKKFIYCWIRYGLKFFEFLKKIMDPPKCMEIFENLIAKEDDGKHENKIK
jgi:hypothetical protein